jgi:hypothetical protein
MLLAERFGGTAPAPAAFSLTDLGFEAIRAQAAEEAARLWSRMAPI